MNPIFIEVNGYQINIVQIAYYKATTYYQKDYVLVKMAGSKHEIEIESSINEFNAKIDEALAKKN